MLIGWLKRAVGRENRLLKKVGSNRKERAFINRVRSHGSNIVHVVLSGIDPRISNILLERQPLPLFKPRSFCISFHWTSCRTAFSLFTGYIEVNHENQYSSRVLGVSCICRLRLESWGCGTQSASRRLVCQRNRHCE